MHYINSTIEQTVRANVYLVRALDDLPGQEGGVWEAARERYLQDRFREKILGTINWEINGVYSRIVPAMFEHQQLTYLVGKHGLP